MHNGQRQISDRGFVICRFECVVEIKRATLAKRVLRKNKSDSSYAFCVLFSIHVCSYGYIFVNMIMLRVSIIITLWL